MLNLGWVSPKLSNIMKQTLDSLTDKCLDLMEKKHYSSLTIKHFRQTCKCALAKFMISRNEKYYSPSIGQDFLFYKASTKNELTMGAYNRAIRVLNDYLETGDFKKRYCSHPKNHVLPGVIGDLAHQYLEYCIETKRWKQGTVDFNSLLLSRYAIYCQAHNISSACLITENNLADFIENATCQSDMQSALRGFFRYLYELQLVSHDYYEILRGKRDDVDILPSVYSAEELRKIDQSVHQLDPKGIRDYAILVLAMRLGLRSSDIGNLKLTDIDWDANVIRIIQYKTNKSLELPLLPDVGEAIVNYLKNVRPKVSLPNVFVSLIKPYSVMTHISINSVVARIIRRSGVTIGQRHFGPHSMRHSLATQLLAQGISLPVISDILGHSTTNSTMVYLRVNLFGLMKLTMDVPEVPQNFYEQKGGAFYEKC